MKIGLSTWILLISGIFVSFQNAFAAEDRGLINQSIHSLLEERLDQNFTSENDLIAEKKKKVASLYINLVIKGHVQFIKGNIDSQFDLDLDFFETMSSQSGIRKIGELKRYIEEFTSNDPLLMNKYIKFRESLVNEIVGTMKQHFPEVQDIGMWRNVIHSFMFFSELFKKHFEFSKERAEVASFDLSDPNGKDIKEFSKLTTDAVQSISLIISEKYYPLFKGLLDFDRDLSEKSIWFLKYQG